MRLYGKYFMMQVRIMLQYPLNFIMLSAGQFLVSFTGFLGVYFLVWTFGEAGGFTLGETMLCAGVTLAGFALAECFFRGFDTFRGMVSTGRFDYILLRPRGHILQMLGSTIEFSRIGRLAQAVFMLIWGIREAGVVWSLPRAALLAYMIWCGMLYFAAFFILYAAICFFTIEGLEFLNLFTDGGREAGMYPLSAYGKDALRLFTFVMPLACVQYWPMLLLTERSQDWRLAWLPLVCIPLCASALGFWRFGIRKYTSSGS